MKKRYWAWLMVPVFALACNSDSGLQLGAGSPSVPPSGGIELPGTTSCQLVTAGFGEAGVTPVRFEKIVAGLEVPWSVLFVPAPSGLSGWDILVSERPGRVRLVRAGELQPDPIMSLTVGEGGEGGLLGMALHPDFTQNSLFYVYYTTLKPTGNFNRIERFKLSADHLHAVSDKLIIDDIPAGTFHNGGRIHFGPDGMLYVGTGDARNAGLAQDRSSPNGKILRLTPEGGNPADNPESGRPWFIDGVRNVEAFDWIDSQTLVIADNGPTGEYLGRTGADEVDIARKGDNLGWPTHWRCEQADGFVAPILSWVDAVPPGGAVIYRGEDIPQWKGNVIIGTLGSKHLHRVVLDPVTLSVSSHEVYFQGDPPSGLGRIRDVIQGPRGELYVTTSNCDSRGICPSDKDGIFRIRL